MSEKGYLTTESPVQPRGIDRRRREHLAVAILALCGAAAFVFTMSGADPANLQQASDFRLFYFPTIQAFAADPIGALPNYNAAPTPLYFLLQGGVLALFHDPAFVRFASLLLGLGVGWAVWAFPASRPRRMVALAALLVSPYFRGQVWHSNGDVLALLLMLLALRPVVTVRGRIAATLVAATTVYVRQSFFFLPAYVWLRGVLQQRWSVFAPSLAAAIIGMPLLALLMLWHGIAPPRYAGHLSPSVIPATLGVGLTISAIYLAPLIIMRALRPRRLLNDLRSLPPLVHFLILAASIFYAITPQLFAEIKGGGVIFLGVKALGQAAHLPLMVGFLPAFVVSAYAMAICVQRDVWRNVLILAATLSMSISVLIYQRYFDPLIVLLLLLHVRRPELDLLERKGMLWVMALPVAFIALAASLTH
jgi:hypothetical protein